MRRDSMRAGRCPRWPPTQRQLRNDGSVDSQAVTVSLVDPVDTYTQADRASKYGVLFVLLTFLGFILFELIKSLRIHPLQYLMVGLALAIFFLLLISLSEHIAFWKAYLVSAVACIGLQAVPGQCAGPLEARLRLRGAADRAVRRAVWPAGVGEQCAADGFAAAVRDPGAGDVGDPPGGLVRARRGPSGAGHELAPGIAATGTAGHSGPAGSGCTAAGTWRAGGPAGHGSPRPGPLPAAAATCQGLRGKGLGWLQGAGRDVAQWPDGCRATGHGRPGRALAEIGIDGLPDDWPAHAAVYGCCSVDRRHWLLLLPEQAQLWLGWRG